MRVVHCRRGKGRTGFTLTIPVAGSNGITAITWVGECLKRIGDRFKDGGRSSVMSRRSSKIVGLETYSVAAVSDKHFVQWAYDSRKIRLVKHFRSRRFAPSPAKLNLKSISNIFMVVCPPRPIRLTARSAFDGDPPCRLFGATSSHLDVESDISRPRPVRPERRTRPTMVAAGFHVLMAC